MEAGADFIGMIMWQEAKRAVNATTAKQIAAIANDAGESGPCVWHAY